jgi:hypothetical protein
MSFFCPQCNNIYTKITPSSNNLLNRLQNQKGGGDTPTPTTVSSYNVNEGGGDDQSVIDDILEGKKITSDNVKNIDLVDLLKHPSYKKLQNKQKEIVYNMISDLLPKKPTKEQVIMDSKAYFECTNCGFIEPVKDGTLIMRRVSNSSSSADTSYTNYKDLIHAKELPITRAYKCPNNQCESHKDPEKREAVMLRSYNSIKIEYICRTCTTHW